MISFLTTIIILLAPQQTDPQWLTTARVVAGEVTGCPEAAKETVRYMIFHDINTTWYAKADPLPDNLRRTESFWHNPRPLPFVGTPRFMFSLNDLNNPRIQSLIAETQTIPIQSYQCVNGAVIVFGYKTLFTRSYYHERHFNLGRER